MPGVGRSLLVVSLLTLVLILKNGVVHGLAGPHDRSSVSRSNTPTSAVTIAHNSFELIGATGRFGSLFLRHEGCIALPRHARPGSSSLSGCDRPVTSDSTPIVVATPSTAWNELHQASLRPHDMVYIGNGIPSRDMLRHATLVVPHFGILTVGGPVVSSLLLSPPTYVSGRHANWGADILRQHRIRVELVDDDSTSGSVLDAAAAVGEIMMIHAVRKLLWASCFWLLCHQNHISAPLSVAQVHQERQEDLEQLVKELWPVVLELTNIMRHENGKDSDSDDDGAKSHPMASRSIGEMDSSLFQMSSTLDYLRSYSLSIPGAVPSLPLALSEVRARNGVFYRDPQPFHQSLLMDLTGDRTVEALNKRMLWAPGQEQGKGT